MIFYRRGEYPPCDTKSLIEYLDKQIQECRILALEAKNEKNKVRYLLCEGGRIALERMKEDLLYSMENKIR